MAQSNLEAFYRAQINAIIEESKRQVEVARKETYKEYFPLLIKEGVEPSFYTAVDNFYSDYDPIIYGRNYSLGNILGTEVGDDYAEISFEESNMTVFRNGNSGLYDLVFKEGWHGGAKSGEGHPREGTPYWRRGYVGGNGSFYSIGWGRPAKRAPIPPYEDTAMRIKEFVNNEGNDMFVALWNAHRPNITFSV